MLRNSSEGLTRRWNIHTTGCSDQFVVLPITSNQVRGEIPPTSLSALLKAALRKRKSFANENEYRFVYLTGREPAGPFILNIGDIHDIAFRMRTQDVYDRVEINGRPLSDL